VNVPRFNALFETVPLSAAELLVCIGASGVIFGVLELVKLIWRRGPACAEIAILVMALGKQNANSRQCTSTPERTV
jgi:hypothetical protein